MTGGEKRETAKSKSTFSQAAFYDIHVETETDACSVVEIYDRGGEFCVRASDKMQSIGKAVTMDDFIVPDGAPHLVRFGVTFWTSPPRQKVDTAVPWWWEVERHRGDGSGDLTRTRQRGQAMTMDQDRRAQNGLVTKHPRQNVTEPWLDSRLARRITCSRPA